MYVPPAYLTQRGATYTGYKRSISPQPTPLLNTINKQHEQSYSSIYYEDSTSKATSPIKSRAANNHTRTELLLKLKERRDSKLREI